MTCYYATKAAAVATQAELDALREQLAERNRSPQFPAIYSVVEDRFRGAEAEVRGRLPALELQPVTQDVTAGVQRPGGFVHNSPHRLVPPRSPDLVDVAALAAERRAARELRRQLDEQRRR